LTTKSTPEDKGSPTTDHSGYIGLERNWRNPMIVTARLPFVLAAQIALLIAMAVGAAGEALAQQPSQAQVNAIRQACRADFKKHCARVSPNNSTRAMACLRQNVASLSSPCQQAMGAAAAPNVAAAPATPTAPAAPPAAAPATAAATPAAAAAPSRAQLGRIRQACNTDFRKHCKGVRPDGAAALACLNRNAATLSGRCQQTLSGAAGAGTATAAEPRPKKSSRWVPPWMRR
jgi:hypothetical protein